MADWLVTGGFVPIADAARIVGAGRELAARLQNELGSDVSVEYWPEPIGPPGVKARA